MNNIHSLPTDLASGGGGGGGGGGWEQLHPFAPPWLLACSIPPTAQQTLAQSCRPTHRAGVSRSEARGNISFEGPIGPKNTSAGGGRGGDPP